MGDNGLRMGAGDDGVVDWVSGTSDLSVVDLGLFPAPFVLGERGRCNDGRVLVWSWNLVVATALFVDCAVDGKRSTK